jgi:hypothetical protein
MKLMPSSIHLMVHSICWVSCGWALHAQGRVKKGEGRFYRSGIRLASALD